MSQQLAVGIDIGGTNTKFGVVDRRGTILCQDRMSTKAHEEVTMFLAELHERVFVGRVLGKHRGQGDLELFFDTVEDARLGSGVATLAIPGSAGVTAAAAAGTIVLPFNDRTAVAVAFAEHAGRIAAVVVEPVAANTGVIAPAPGFLEHLRASTRTVAALGNGSLVDVPVER